MTNNKVLIDALNEAKDALEHSYDMTQYPATDDCRAAQAIRTIDAALASNAEEAPDEISFEKSREELQRYKSFFPHLTWEEVLAHNPHITLPLPGGQVTGKSAGADRIAKERAEQIEKHHRTIDHDVERNYMGELVMAAKAILTSEDGQFPAGWDLTIIQKMCDKPYPERVVIAGAFLAAEYDRISADPHWEEELRDEFKAGKQPEQQPEDLKKLVEHAVKCFQSHVSDHTYTNLHHETYDGLEASDFIAQNWDSWISEFLPRKK